MVDHGIPWPWSSGHHFHLGRGRKSPPRQIPNDKLLHFNLISYALALND